MTTRNSHKYRVVCSSGDDFYTAAQTPTEYVLDPTFIQFIALSVFMFTSLTMAVGLPLVPQIILFSAGIFATFFSLTLCIKVYVLVIDAFGFQTIYTPLLLVPMQFLVTFLVSYILQIFGTSFTEGFGGVWEVWIRTFIIIISLDIFHGKFVASQHGLTVFYDEDGNLIPKGSVTSRTSIERVGPVSPAPQPSARPAAVPAAASSEPATPEEEIADAGAAPQPAPSRQITVGKETFDIDTIDYIQSEDHYLVLQTANQAKMVRGKLRDLAAQIDPVWGLQVNRSVWVSYAAIAEVHEQPKGQVTIKMSDGACIKVTNSRKLYFEHGCMQHAPSVKCQKG